jgi:tryptophan halogenase
MVLNSGKKFRLGVIGAGTAGIVSISHIIPWLSNSWDIVSIYDPNTPILGIGESTNPNFLSTLEFGTGFRETEDIEKLEGTLKFGTKYIGWRSADWINPLFGAGHALHFNNFKLKEFAFERFKQKWPEKFKVIEGAVASVTNEFQCVHVNVDNVIEKFDYVIDCRGFPDDYSDYEISNCSPLNRCFVYSTPPHVTDQFLCTEHIATKHGWTFGIPLSTRHTYGYLFNDTISTEDQVIQDMSEMFSTDLKKDNLVDYKFKSYYTKKILDKRILKNGNRALFFEPLSASSIFCYVEIAELFLHHLNKNEKYNEFFVNTEFVKLAKSLEDMLSFLYHGGTNFDTEFWRFAKARAVDRLNNSNAFSEIIVDYKKMFKNGTPLTGKSWFFLPHNLRIIDEQMNYNYFKEL